MVKLQKRAEFVNNSFIVNEIEVALFPFYLSVYVKSSISRL